MLKPCNAHVRAHLESRRLADVRHCRSWPRTGVLIVFQREAGQPLAQSSSAVSVRQRPLGSIRTNPSVLIVSAIAFEACVLGASGENTAALSLKLRNPPALAERRRHGGHRLGGADLPRGVEGAVTPAVGLSLMRGVGEDRRVVGGMSVEAGRRRSAPGRAPARRSARRSRRPARLATHQGQANSSRGVDGRIVRQEPRGPGRDS